MSGNGGGFSAGGDFLPPGDPTSGVAVVKAGTRYLGFSISSGGVYAADITDYQSNVGASVKNAIYSEVIRNVGVSFPCRGSRRRGRAAE